MLEEVLLEINNFFVVPDGVHAGTFTVTDGGIDLPFLLDGQYFRIIGSRFNDGLHQYPAADLIPETFDGVVWEMAVPPPVVDMAEEIKAWNAKFQAIPYTSESFGPNARTRATNASGVPVGWRDVFRDRLNKWRRIGGLRP